MSSFNQLTGWYGYTINTDTSHANEHGETNQCMFVINYGYSCRI